MTRSDLVSRVSAIFPYVNVGNVERIISIIIDLMIDKLRNGGRIELRDFGAFSTRERGESQGRNPRNGEKVVIKAKKVPFFRAGKKLRDAVNGREWIRDNSFGDED
ncbi:MAG: integration host factor subunit beta [Alphaproteobacteria bacterium]|nr:integration host factor subunit beta [Alphaproteobacteria bacterium]